MSCPSPKPCTALRSTAEHIMPHTSRGPVKDQRVEVFIASDPSGHQLKRNASIPSYFCCLTEAALSQLAQGQSLLTDTAFGAQEENRHAQIWQESRGKEETAHRGPPASVTYCTWWFSTLSWLPIVFELHCHLVFLQRSALSLKCFYMELMHKESWVQAWLGHVQTIKKQIFKGKRLSQGKRFTGFTTTRSFYFSISQPLRRYGWMDKELPWGKSCLYSLIFFGVEGGELKPWFKILHFIMAQKTIFSTSVI